MMVKRRQFIITITSTFLLLGLFYKVPQHRNDVDRDGFQNDPAILGGTKNTNFQNSMGALSNPISFAIRISKQFLFSF